MATTDLSIAGGNFHVRMWTGGSGTPTVFLHGVDGFQADTPFLQALASGRRVYAPEHPGYGESTGIDHIDDIIDMALYYRDFIEALGHESVDLVGHSLGGMFAAEIAALSPHRVRKLVLVSPFGLWLDEAQIPDLFVMSPNALQRATWHDPDSHVAQATLTQAANGSSGGAAIITRAMNLSTAGKFLWPIPDRGLAKRLHYIKAPALIVMGASDGLVPAAYGDAFRRGIAGSQLAVIANAGHLPHVEQPEEFARIVDAFLA